MGYRLYAALGAAFVIAAFLTWVWRIDTLRSHYKRDLAASEANFAQFRADVASTTALAQAQDAAHAAQVERDQEKIRSESDAEIRRRIDAAVASVRARTAPADSGSGGKSGMSEAADSAGSASGAGQAAVVSADDLAICAENTVKAEGWQAWWKDVSAVAR
jgi:hypothetical protein